MVKVSSTSVLTAAAVRNAPGHVTRRCCSAARRKGRRTTRRNRNSTRSLSNYKTDSPRRPSASRLQTTARNG